MTLDEAKALQPGTLVVVVADAEEQSERHCEDIGGIWEVTEPTRPYRPKLCADRVHCEQANGHGNRCWFLTEHIRVATAEDVIALLREIVDLALPLQTEVWRHTCEETSEPVELSETALGAFRSIRRLANLLP